MKALTKTTLATLMLSQLLACGNSNDSKKSAPLETKNNNESTTESITPILEDNLEELETETYLAVLRPINPHVGGDVNGGVTVFKDRDFMVVDVRVNGSAPNMIHAQYIHNGIVCPDESTDINKDGVVDITEALNVTRDVIIPLDGDINAQYSMLATFPTADQWGSYVYSQTASFQRFLADLKGEDENTTDNIVKVSGSLGLAGKVVMIQGTADFVALPATASGKDGLTAHQTLPVACGVLVPITSVPGTYQEDNVTVGTTRSGDDTPGLNPERQDPTRPRKPSRRRSNQKPCPGETTIRRDGKECPR